MRVEGSRRWPLAVALLTLGGLLVRVAIVLATRHDFRLGVDAADYQRLALSILHGHGFGTSHFAAGGGPTALRPPGFPIWLAGVEAPVGGSVLAGRVADAVAGSAVVPLTVVLARHVGVTRWLALLAGVIVALDPQLVLAATSLMSEADFVPLSLGSVVAMLAYRRSGSRAALLAAAACLGLAVVTRPVAVVLVIPLLLLGIRAPARGRRRAGAALLAAAVALAPAVAWEVRTTLALHQFEPLTTQGGYLLAGTYNGTSASYRPQPGVWLPASLDPHIRRILAAHPHAGEAATSDLLAAAAQHYVIQHPGYVGTVLDHNALRLFDLTGIDFERRINESQYGAPSAFASSEQIGALLLLALALLGILRGALSRWPRWLWLAPVLLVLVTLPVQSFTRFRAPVDPYLAVLAVGTGLHSTRERLSRLTAWRR